MRSAQLCYRWADSIPMCLHSHISQTLQDGAIAIFSWVPCPSLGSPPKPIWNGFCCRIREPGLGGIPKKIHCGPIISHLVLSPCFIAILLNVCFKGFFLPEHLPFLQKYLSLFCHWLYYWHTGECRARQNVSLESSTMEQSLTWFLCNSSVSSFHEASSLRRFFVRQPWRMPPFY